MKYTELYVQFLENLVGKNTEELKVLTAHRNLLKEDLSKSTERISDLEASTDRLFNSLNEKYTTIAKQGDELEKYHSAMYKLEAERQQLSNEVSKLREEKDNWLAGFEEVNVKNLQYITQIKEKHAQELKEYVQKLDQKSKELDEMSTQLDEKQEIIDTQEQEIEQLLCGLEQCRRNDSLRI